MFVCVHVCLSVLEGCSFPMNSPVRLLFDWAVGRLAGALGICLCMFIIFSRKNFAYRISEFDVSLMDLPCQLTNPKSLFCMR